MTMSLIKSYGLVDHLKVLGCRKATREEMESFHSSDYLDFCQIGSEQRSEEDEFRMSYDCVVLPKTFSLMEWVAGASVSAAQALVSGKVRAAINWGGGWHHAQRENASGFCYVNDVVLAILALRKKFDRVLYVDLDIHHGNHKTFCIHYILWMNTYILS